MGWWGEGGGSASESMGGDGRADDRKGLDGMVLTKSFGDLVRSRVARDPDFAAALLREGIDTMLAGDVDAGRAILRDYIKATVGFEMLGAATDMPPKSLIRMFGPRGNPQARNFSARGRGRSFRWRGTRLSARRRWASGHRGRWRWCGL